MTRGQRTLAAIMLTDAVGFSARMSVDEETTLGLIQRDQHLMRTLCQHYEGRVLKSTGDGLLMAFTSAVQAVHCGLKIQSDLHRRNQALEPGQSLMHRIGIHLGDVFFSESDVMGNGVNITARLQTEAEPGGLCISQTVYDVVKSRLTLDATYAGPLKLKNIQDPVPAYHLRTEASVAQAQAMERVTVVESTDVASPRPPQASSPRGLLRPGNRVGGRYVIQRVLGQGGFGRSYLVDDTQRFGEACVLKEFFPTNKSGKSLQKAVDLFKREAKTLYQLNHPQVPKFLACFTQAQRLFLVQEYIDGVSYSQLLRQRRQEGSFFSEAEVIQWLGHMLRVLDYLHGLNIVHRDISPDNVMYARDRDLPVLIDFGLVNDALSTLLQDDDSDSFEDAAKPATMVGKFGYSPPEQIRLGQCYPCSDLYALGVTALVLLTGQSPRDLMDQDSLEWRWQQEVHLSPDLTRLLERLVRQRPKERFQTARDVLVALTGEVLPPPKAGMPNSTGSFVRPQPVLASSRVYDEAFLQRCRQELTRCIGPMASLVLEDAIDQNPMASAAELVEIIAAQLSDSGQSEAFLSRLQTLDETSQQSWGSASLSLDAAHLGSLNAEGNSQQGPRVSPEFLARCRQALTRCIGPMATIVLDEILEEDPLLSPQALIERLAEEIPDPQQVDAFRQQLGSGLG